MKHDHHQVFYGTTTLGEKGQVVIPSEARAALKLKKGEKMLVFSMGHGMIALAKLEQLAAFEKHMTERLKALRSATRSVR